MNVSKIKIKNLFGITEKELDGKSIELSGKKWNWKNFCFRCN